jgi:hypothetical protein
VEAGATYGFGPASLSLLPVDGGYLAAWPEGAPGTFEGQPMGAFSVIRVARLDESGTLREAPVVVRAKVDDVDSIEPHLARFGSNVALSWSTGNHIYVCAGCVPDNKIELVVIDEETLAPVSNVVELVPTSGGLLRRRIAVLGDDLASIFQITFHVHSETGTGAFRCVD